MSNAADRDRRAVLFAAGAAGLAALTAPGCAWLGLDDRRVRLGGTKVDPGRPIMDALRASADHRRLTEALEAGPLAEALSGPGPFTVFAPTDKAFGGFLPSALRDSLPGAPAQLQEILRTHVLRAVVDAGEIADALPGMGGRSKLLTLNDQFLRIDGTRERLRLLDRRNRAAGLIQTNARASNGVIHVIDNVLLPPEDALE